MSLLDRRLAFYRKYSCERLEQMLDNLENDDTPDYMGKDEENRQEIEAIRSIMGEKGCDTAMGRKKRTRKRKTRKAKTGKRKSRVRKRSRSARKGKSARRRSRK